MQRQSLNDGWRFHLGQIARHEQPSDAEWQPVMLPHDWSIGLERARENPSRTDGGYFPMGAGWYRREIAAPKEWRGKKVFVEFEGIYMNAEVGLNEHFLQRHPYGYTSFLVDLTSFLRFGEENKLWVFVDNASQLNSRWYSGSGIYRPAWLIVAEPVHVAHWGVYVTTPEVSPESATVRARTSVQNETGAAQAVILRSRVLAPDGTPLAACEARATVVPGDSSELAQELFVSQPQLWSPDSPSLYRLESELLAEGRTVDTEATTFGIRTLHFDARSGFLLNGQPLLLKGGCVHHDNGVLGAASYPRSEERKVALHKASGYNAIRCAHNPPAPAFLDACDRLGMLVIDEAFDCWRQGKNPYDYHVAFDDWWQRDIHSMVRRDRNHACVIIWSIGNEVHERDGRSDGARIARMLAGYVRALDPTRPITSAICGVWDVHCTWLDTDPVFAALDVGGYNYQWENYRPDHGRHPERIMAGLESFPIEALENWTSVQELPYVIGDFVWTSLDYLGESGIGRVYFGDEEEWSLGEYPWHQANCGDLDLCGFKRPQSYYRDILWGAGTELYIAVHAPVPGGQIPHITRWGWPEVWPDWTWPGRESEIFKVDVYSACDQVELFLNGRSLGVKPATRAEHHIASFDVPYEPGVLLAVGQRSDGGAAEYEVHTAGKPAGVRLSPDRAAIAAGPGELSFITAEVVDAAGLVHPKAEDEIVFSVKGEGSLVALGSSNPMSTEPYVGDRRRAFRGRCLAVVRSSGVPGAIRVHGSAAGLQAAETTINAE
jgi:beta-galactosidase